MLNPRALLAQSRGNLNINQNDNSLISNIQIIQGGSIGGGRHKISNSEVSTLQERLNQILKNQRLKAINFPGGLPASSET
jgi:hypothetical protein